jgi:Uma2 family endonuclease
VCGDAAFAETRLATLLNPTVVIEVISPSSERADRGIKFDCYRTIRSLMAYVLVSQDEPRIEVYSRRSDNAWQYDVAVGLDSIIRLTPDFVTLVLKDVYTRVEFAADANRSIAPSS